MIETERRVRGEGVEVNKMQRDYSYRQIIKTRTSKTLISVRLVDTDEESK